MIYIYEDYCKGCHLCLYTCYKNVYAISKETNKNGVQLPYVNFEERCTKCGACEIICPDQAITVDIDANWWVKNNEYDKFNPNMTNAIGDY